MADMDSTAKLVNFNREDIDEYIARLKEAINQGKYSISRNDNRKENDDFINDYRITTDKEIEIFNSLNSDDFCYAVNNKTPNSLTKYYTYFAKNTC